MAAQKPNSTALTYRFQRVHPALNTGHYLTVKAQREDPVRVFMKQGDFDGACGLHVLAMVLTILDLAKSCALENMSRRKFGVPAQVWSAFQHTYFEGVQPKEFSKLVQTLNLPLNVTLHGFRDGKIDCFAADCLMDGELVALAFASVNNRRTNHWALGVGVEGTVCGRETRPDTLLMLDPGGTEPVFRAFNTRLRVPQSGPGSRGGKLVHRSDKFTAHKRIDWLYDSPDWATEPVRLLAAVRFRLATKKVSA